MVFTDQFELPKTSEKVAYLESAKGEGVICFTTIDRAIVDVVT